VVHHGVSPTDHQPTASHHQRTLPSDSKVAAKAGSDLNGSKDILCTRTFRQTTSLTLHFTRTLISTILDIRILRFGMDFFQIETSAIN
jgi:hypothetical protein